MSSSLHSELTSYLVSDKLLAVEISLGPVAGKGPGRGCEAQDLSAGGPRDRLLVRPRNVQQEAATELGTLVNFTGVSGVVGRSLLYHL